MRAVEERCAALRAAADDFAAELRKEFRVQLIKIPKKVRARRNVIHNPRAKLSSSATTTTTVCVEATLCSPLSYVFVSLPPSPSNLLRRFE
jgi:hypothetical protein